MEHCKLGIRREKICRSKTGLNHFQFYLIAKVKTKFKDSTSLYLLSSSILALNVTLHRNLPSMALMKKDEFIRMNKDVNPEILESIYEEIKNNKLEITYECKIIFLKKK